MLKSIREVLGKNVVFLDLCKLITIESKKNVSEANSEIKLAEFFPPFCISPLYFFPPFYRQSFHISRTISHACHTRAIRVLTDLNNKMWTTWGVVLFPAIWGVTKLSHWREIMPSFRMTGFWSVYISGRSSSVPQRLLPLGICLYPFTEKIRSQIGNGDMSSWCPFNTQTNFNFDMLRSKHYN